MTTVPCSPKKCLMTNGGVVILFFRSVHGGCAVTPGCLLVSESSAHSTKELLNSGRDIGNLIPRNLNAMSTLPFKQAAA